MGDPQDLYEHNWGDTAELAASAKSFAGWMDGKVVDTQTASSKLGAAWASDAASTFVDGKLKEAINRCEGTKSGIEAYHTAVSTSSSIASGTEHTNANVVSG
jgi:hypothetical protein